MHKCLREGTIKMCTVCAPVARQTLKKNVTEKFHSIAYLAIFSLQLTHSLEEHQTKGEKSALQLFGIFHIKAYKMTRKQSVPTSHC